MELNKFVTMAVIIATASLCALLPVRAQNVITVQNFGTVIDTSGRVVEFTLDTRGNLIDRSGAIIVTSTDTTGYVLDLDSGTIKGRIDRAGNIIEFGGSTIALAPGSRYMVIDPPTRTVRGTLDPKGHLIAFDLQTNKSTIVVPASMNGYLVDPVSLKLKGTMSSSGRLFDTSGSPMSRSDAIGFVVVDSSSGFIKGFINRHKDFVAYKLPQPVITSTVAQPIVIKERMLMPTAVTELVPSTTTIVREEVTSPATTTERRIVTTETRTVPLASGTTYVAIDPITGSVLGTLDSSLKLATGPLAPGTIVVDKSTGLAIGAMGEAGVVSLESAPVTTTFLANIDRLRAEVDAAIADQLAKGALTGDEAMKLRADLNRLITQLSTAKTYSEVFTITEGLPLTYKLRTIERAFPTFKPIAVGSRFIVVDGGFKLLDEIGVRRFELEQRIDLEHATGRLTTAEKAILMSRMDKIASIEATYRADGDLDYVESRKLFVSFDRVGSALDGYVAHRNRTRKIVITD